MADAFPQDPSGAVSRRHQDNRVQDAVACRSNSPSGAVLWMGNAVNEASVMCSVQPPREDLGQGPASLRRRSVPMLAY